MSWQTRELEKQISAHKQKVMELKQTLELQKKKDYEKEKLTKLLWSGRKKYLPSSYVMRNAVLNPDVCRTSILWVDSIDDLKLITRKDWQNRKVLKDFGGRLSEPTKFIYAGKESWKRLQECIKRSSNYK